MLNIEGIRKIGIIKGGQLGKMLIQEILNYGFEVYVLDPDTNAPCKDLCTEFIIGDPTNLESVYQFGKNVDVLAVEFENICVGALEKLEKEGVKVFPSSSILRVVQDKGLQKQFYKDNIIPTADFVTIENKTELQGYQHFFPAIQKSRLSGYDGKGVYTIQTQNDIENAFDQPSILEKKIDFEKEISVIVARDSFGSIAFYSLVEMEFHPQKNLVEFLYSPAKVDNSIEQKAFGLAKKIIEKLNMVGILAVEMFLLQNGEIIVNEISPRLHNSGHHTIEANITSQFDQFLRTILNFPLGSTKALMPSAMVNILGAEEYYGEAKYLGIDKVLSLEKTYIHLYGKKYTRPYRKMGHVTVLGETLEEVKEKAKIIKNTLKVIA